MSISIVDGSSSSFLSSIMNRVLKHPGRYAKLNLLGGCVQVLCEYRVFHVPMDKDIERVLRIWYPAGHILAIPWKLALSSAYQY